MGYAQSVTYPPDVKYQDVFLQLQREARESERGLWGPPPTQSPQPTGLSIIAVDKRAEYVDIHNGGDQAQDLSGWVLVSVRGNQTCTLGEVLGPGETLRIWAQDNGQGGYNCGFDTNIWNNSESDPAELYDAGGQLVDSYP